MIEEALVDLEDLSLRDTSEVSREEVERSNCRTRGPQKMTGLWLNF